MSIMPFFHQPAECTYHICAPNSRIVTIQNYIMYILYIFIYEQSTYTIFLQTVKYKMLAYRPGHHKHSYEADIFIISRFLLVINYFQRLQQFKARIKSRRGHGLTQEHFTHSGAPVDAHIPTEGTSRCTVSLLHCLFTAM